MGGELSTSIIATGFISLGILVLTNVIIVAYSYGKITQSVADVCRRVERVEDKIFGPDG